MRIKKSFSRKAKKIPQGVLKLRLELWKAGLECAAVILRIFSVFLNCIVYSLEENFNILKYNEPAVS